MLPQIPKCDCVATSSSCDRVATNNADCPFERRSLLKELAAKGVRLTAQRRAVIEIIQDAGEHLDASALLTQARIREPNIDRATVYRTIDLLKKLRLIDELDLMHLKGEKHFYEVKTRRDHVHLACFQCGRIEEFSSIAFEKLKSELAMQTGFEVRVTRLEVGGRCRACTAKTEELPKH
jgi:Fur family ferric uptake transcriptional regulator